MDDGQLMAEGGIADHPLPAVEQRADLRNIGPVQISHRLEAGQPPLVKQRQKKGLHRIVKMVAQGDLVQLQLLHGVVDGSPTHLGAHGAGILFLAHIEDDLKDLGLNDMVRHIQLPAQFLHPAEVHLRHAGVDGDGVELKGYGIELLQLGHGIEQNERVLASGQAHRDAVAGPYHLIVLDTPAHMG